MHLVFSGGESTSQQLPELYALVAKTLGCHYFNSAQVVQSSPIDGVHLGVEAHDQLGRAIAPLVETILSAPA
ncbi:hypothetical protein DO97_09435 [Neosynechococcus sphagnicola sy1]|uniref:Uncharacterized protein n=1 Tax=Neosynechococcus sphagnicola sy1 TaxID=1497020 RepID=A0A098TJG7_9CYAN|nr:hypothetical protein [Neosynechococcus sphagnicola]KGF72319.1 hypothetical protein DO97_09435 [Neosynechococcus sphagnicola sy1]